MGFVQNKMVYIMKNYAIAILILVIIIIVSFISPNFFTVRNMGNVLNQISVIGIVSCGMAIVIISGGIDLSVGSIVSLIGVLAINMAGRFGEIPAILIAMIIGTVIGGISGSIIAKINGKLGESFMVTFGGLTVIASIAFIYTGGIFQQGNDLHLFDQIGRGVWPIIIFISIVVIMQFLLTKTVFGRIIYFIGGNSEATRLSGINIRLYRTLVFMASGLMSAIAAIVLTSRVGAASPSAGLGYELDAIAAVVVGGVSLTGGRGSMLNALMGVILMGVLGNALNIMNVSSYPQMIIRGIIIIVAVSIDVWNKRNI